MPNMQCANNHHICQADVLILYVKNYIKTRCSYTLIDVLPKIYKQVLKECSYSYPCTFPCICTSAYSYSYSYNDGVAIYTLPII